MSARWPWTLVFVFVFAIGSTWHPAYADASGRWLPDQRLVESSELAYHDEIVRRVLTPIAYDLAVAYGRGAGVALRGQSMQVAGEHVDLYVPEGVPKKGYGLLVFVAPTRDLGLPMDWRRVLARHGVILAAPRNAGNGSHAIGRRIPLALHAYEHVRARYPLDAERLYVGGFSGGSRIALSVALAYADVFRGAFLVAGSAEIGGRGPTPPPAAIMALAQAHTRLVFATGERDRGALDRDRVSQRALRRYCVVNLTTLVQRQRGHELPGGRGLDDALRALDAPAGETPDPAACRSALAAEVDASLAAVSSRIAAGQRAAAGELLGALDRRYGGLAAPRSVALARCLVHASACADE